MMLNDKVAVITGAGSGMGLATAKRFAAEGASLVVGEWVAERLDALIADIKGSGGSIVGAQGNIADKATAEALIDVAVSTYGRIDVLVNNAGVMDSFQGVAELSDDVWRRVFGINVEGPLFTMRRAIPTMIEQGRGAIVNIASLGGLRGGWAGAAYTASKHALIGLTKNTAWMYGPRGVRTNAIAPGGTRTNIMDEAAMARIDPLGAERILGSMLNLPVLQPEDIAAVALFLASDEARFINGAIITADAGAMAK